MRARSARRHIKTAGQIISAPAKKLEPGAAPKMRTGVPLFAPRPGAKKPSLALVNRLRDSQ